MYLAQIGSNPSIKTVDTAEALKWLKFNSEGFAEITPAGCELISLITYESQLRQALLDYVDIVRPPWLQNAMYGRISVLRFAGNEIAQIFFEAGLVCKNDDDIVRFWDLLAAKARGQKHDYQIEIGRKGERLTIEYEKERTGKEPKWIALDNNSDGYDVLSILYANKNQPLTIEVKTTTQGIDGFFYLTRNEWEMSVGSNSHCFHLWNLRVESEPFLAILTLEDLQNHIPVNCGNGAWESVKIPFLSFREKFTKGFL
ncbi:DUF3883 domain-containing protein [Acinetobacter sp. ANC 3926]|uniref:DUF3883 domain-containing protein n=1 Tax=Acinetobacter genomosp. 15BJ TaxID=106651 RepID=UPI001F4B7F6D|nr:DUF3883 domain-containing protein [Acinetobacter genomosp. 15BJ]MCH7290194.1 DUF3883 domain-containing protein [Acinetobacter genomosp. 15BJ]